MVDKSPHRIREMFNRISPTYDFLNHLLSANIDIAWRRMAARALEAPKRTLDICCGTGDLALEIAAHHHCTVIGTDFAQGMLRLAKKKAGARVRFAQADALALPFRDNTFDACTVAFGIRNVQHTPRCLEEMCRVVHRGGRAVILEFTLPKPGLLRKAYLAYFNHVLPRIGSLFTRGYDYSYLNESVREWNTPNELSTLMKDVGFRNVSFTLLSFGIAALHVGTK